MARGLSRLASELTSSGAGSDPRCWVEPGVVKAAVSGYLADPIMTVTWRNTDVPCSYVDSYTPAAGDVVLLLIQPPSVICLGRLVGPGTATGN